MVGKRRTAAKPHGGFGQSDASASHSLHLLGRGPLDPSNLLGQGIDAIVANKICSREEVSVTEALLPHLRLGAMRRHPDRALLISLEKGCQLPPRPAQLSAGAACPLGAFLRTQLHGQAIHSQGIEGA